VKTVINEMTAKLKAMGPLGLPEKFEAWDAEVIELARGISGGPRPPVAPGTTDGSAADTLRVPAANRPCPGQPGKPEVAHA
jgi:hypothetical protein